MFGAVRYVDARLFVSGLFGFTADLIALVLENMLALKRIDANE